MAADAYDITRELSELKSRAQSLIDNEGHLSHSNSIMPMLVSMVTAMEHLAEQVGRLQIEQKPTSTNTSTSAGRTTQEVNIPPPKSPSLHSTEDD